MSWVATGADILTETHKQQHITTWSTRAGAGVGGTDEKWVRYRGQMGRGWGFDICEFGVGCSFT